MDITQLERKLQSGKISQEKYELIKAMLIKEKSKARAKDDSLLLKEFQKVVPEVNEELLDKIQNDGSYMKELIKRNIASLTPKLAKVLEKLEEKCMDGDVRAMQLFIKLIGLDKDSVGILKTETNEEKTDQKKDLSKLSDEDLTNQFFNMEKYLPK